MDKLYTTTEVITEEQITQPIALLWAKKNGVSMLGSQYVWTEEQKEAFHKRNKKRGRPNAEKKENM